MTNDRYTGERGTENYLDDYVFGPILLISIAFFFGIIGDYAYYPDPKMGFVLGVFGGVLIDIWLVRKELQYRKQKNNSDD